MTELGGTRASNGRANPYQKANGRWECFVTVGAKSDGKLDRRKVSAKTRAECVEKVKRLESLRSTGAVPKAGQRMTVGQWLDHWLENIVGPSTKPKTWVSYETNVRLYLKPAMGGLRLDRLTPEHIEQMYVEMTKDEKSPATVQSVRRTIRAALNRAVERGYLPKNPAMLAAAPRLVEEEIEPLSVDDARRILETAPTETNGAAWVVHISLGLRRGEVLALRWSDIDLDAPSLSIKRAVQRLPWRHGCDDPAGCASAHHWDRCTNDCRGHARHCPQRKDGGLVFDTPKSRAGLRSIPLPAPLVDLLTAHRAEQHRARMFAGSEWRDHDLVFAQPNGEPLDPDGQSKAWKAYLKRIGVRPARLHDARHTAATLLLLQGVDTRTVMYLMGWNEMAMAKRYQHVVPELREAAMQRMTDALWDKPEAPEATGS
jgi:integrase